MPAPSPPPPRSIGIAPPVPPYMADPMQLKQWEMTQQRHRDAIASAPKFLGQADTNLVKDASWHAARERVKNFKADEARRQIGEGNKILMGHLNEIVQKPGATTKMIEKDPSRHQEAARGSMLRRRQQREIAAENEALVKRLLNVKTTLKRNDGASTWKQHKRDVERLQKVSPPIRQQRRRRECSAPLLLPQIPFPGESSSAASDATTSSTAGVRYSNKLPPLQRSSASQSAPLLATISSSPSTSSRSPKLARHPEEGGDGPLSDIISNMISHISALDDPRQKAEDQPRALTYGDLVGSPSANAETRLEAEPADTDGLTSRSVDSGTARTVDVSLDEELRIDTPAIAEAIVDKVVAQPEADHTGAEDDSPIEGGDSEK